MIGTTDEIIGAKPGSITIIVIEPEILVRMVIADYLRDCGYRVIEGVTADDVFVVLRAGESVDIVFTEIHLRGGIDGFALAKRIRESYSEIDVLLTAGSDSAAGKAGELCDNGPLEKPYHPREVVRRINILRERRRTSQKPPG